MVYSKSHGLYLLLLFFFPILTVGIPGYQPYRESTTRAKYRYNFDGIASYSGREVQEYTQVFNNGAIETVKTQSLIGRQHGKFIPIWTFQENVIAIVRTFLNIEEYYLRAHPPCYVMLSMIGVKEYMISVESHKFPRGEIREGNPIDRDILVLPEIMIDSFSTDVAKAMKGVFDRIWNAAGWPESKSLHE
jgi:hypothetical protein